jgi:hypothetical protein
MLANNSVGTAAAAEGDANPFAQIWQGVKQGVDQATDGKGFTGKIASDVQDNLAGKKPKVLGYVVLGNGAYMTYFDNNKMGFPSNGGPLNVPPRAGTVAPAMMLAPTGTFQGELIANNIDEARKAGLFVASEGNSAGSGASDQPVATGKGVEKVVAQEVQLDDGTWYRNDSYNCRKIWHLDANKHPFATINPHSNVAFSLMAACETATQDKNRKRIRPVANP